MRITQHNNSIIIRCSPNEFEILGIAVDQIEVGDYRDLIDAPNLRKSWGRRVADGPFLRVDRDKRAPGEF